MTGIDRNSMFDRILPILPEFGAELQALKEDYLASPHAVPPAPDFPYYGAANALAHRVITLLENHQTDTIKDVFAVLEDWLLQGDDFVSEVATIGLIEDLQNGNLHPSTQPADLVGLLGPEGRYWWMKVERFWLHGEIIHDDRVRQD